MMKLFINLLFILGVLVLIPLIKKKYFQFHNVGALGLSYHMGKMIVIPYIFMEENTKVQFYQMNGLLL